jgi:hypothetical protein
MNWRRGLLRLWVVLAVSWTALVFGYGYFTYRAQNAAPNVSEQQIPEICKQIDQEIEKSGKLPSTLPAECFLLWTEEAKMPPAPSFWTYPVIAATPPLALLAAAFLLNWLISGFKRS